MEIKSLWDVTDFASTHFDENLELQRARFIAHVDGEAITRSTHFFLNKDPLELATSLGGMTGSVVTGSSQGCYLLSGSMSIEGKRYPCLVFVKGGDKESNSGPVSTWVTVTAHRKVIQAIGDYIAAVGEAVNRGSIRWWYFSTSRTPDHRDISLEDDPKEVLHPEYYPALKGGPFNFMKEYLNSNASIWVLGGLPGTGKTTLLRKMITHHRLSAHVVYDAELMKNEAIIMSFLFSDATLMIFEDAEQVLLPRLSGNEAMAKFLNASNGLVKLPRKKIIFTTNCFNLSKIDEALLREGRCFATTNLEPLTYEQALAVCKVGGMTPPTNPKKTYTLAKLFNPR